MQHFSKHHHTRDFLLRWLQHFHLLGGFSWIMPVALPHSGATTSVATAFIINIVCMQVQQQSYYSQCNFFVPQRKQARTMSHLKLRLQPYNVCAIIAQKKLARIIHSHTFEEIEIVGQKHWISSRDTPKSPLQATSFLN